MNYFVIGYYALLIGGSCLAAYFQKRYAFLLLFSLTLASFLMGIIGGESVRRWIDSDVVDGELVPVFAGDRVLAHDQLPDPGDHRGAR